MSMPSNERNERLEDSRDSEIAEPEPSGPARPRWLRAAARVTTTLCVLYILWIVGALLVMRLAGERWWFATLLLFSPRWIWAAPLVLLLPLSLWFRRRMAIPVAMTGAVVLFAIIGFRVPWRSALPAPATHQSLRLFTCNLHGRQSDPALLQRLIAEARPDVILFQDYSGSRRPAIVHRPGWRGEQDHELYIASRFPFRRTADLLPRDAAAWAYASHQWPVGEAFSYEIDLPDGQTVHLVNVHLASPHQQLQAIRERRPTGPAALQADSDRREFESMTVSAAAAHFGGPVIIAGDFNTPDDSPLFAIAWDGFKDAFNCAGFGFGTTYSRHHTWLRIDHILFDPSWSCRTCEVGPPIGSGHRPVFAILDR